MALNSLLCADVPLSNYSLIHSRRQLGCRACLGRLSFQVGVDSRARHGHIHIPFERPSRAPQNQCQPIWVFSVRSTTITVKCRVDVWICFVQDICKTLWCYSDNFKCETKHLPAADGTHCGIQKVTSEFFSDWLLNNVKYSRLASLFYYIYSTACRRNKLSIYIHNTGSNT